MAVVLLITVLIDLIAAVGIGLVLASLLFVKRMADLELANLRLVTAPSKHISLNHEEIAILERNRGKIVLIHVDGPMSFGSAKNMVRRLENVKGFNNFSSVVLDLSDVPAIDGTAALAVEDMLAMIQAHKQHLFFTGMHPGVRKVLEGMGVTTKMRPGHQFALRADALRQAAYEAGSSHPDDRPPGMRAVRRTESVYS
jgi:SulP family sulfate permease